MKILIVNDYKKKIGGCETYLHNLEEKLIERGHDVVFLGGEEGKSKIKKYLKSIYNLNFKQRFTKLMKIFTPDIIFSRSIHNNISPSFMNEAKKNQIPIVMNLPRFEPYSLKSNLSIHKYLKTLYLIHTGRKHVDLWVAQSNFMYKFLKKNFETSKIVKIYHPRFWNTPEKVKESGEKSKFQIIYVGRLQKSKGVHVLIKSANILQKKGYDFVVNIIGIGADEENLKDLTKKLNLNSIVNFKGFVDYRDLKEIYYKSDTLVHPCTTFKETFGLSIVEALSQGTPVITTKIGAQQEHIKNGYNGFLVDPNDPHQIANRLESLIDNRDRLKDMSKNAIKSSDRYDIDTHLNKLINKFQKLLK